jgi:hypothetical protein
LIAASPDPSDFPTALIEETRGTLRISVTTPRGRWKIGVDSTNEVSLSR